MLKVSILSIGDEILIGQILNSNSKWLAEKITQIGCSIAKINTIGDSSNEIISELNILLPISDIIVITGGLGPTHDDITKDVLCNYFNDKLIENNTWTKKLIDQFNQRGMDLSERNKTQAFIPSRSTLLWNDFGTAPGMLFNENGKLIFSLPGVPQEMVNIMENVGFQKIIDLLNSSNTESIIYKNIQTNNIPESSLADLIDIKEDFLGNSSLAFLPSYRGVKLRIGAYGESKSQAEKELSRIENYLIPRIDNYIISFDERPFAQIISEKLIIKNKTLAIAESCTAGLLSATLTDIPGSSKYFKGSIVAYSNDIKNKLLNINNEQLEKYGAVSKEIAEEMSNNIRKIFNSDYGISITGIAGPSGGTKEKPVGTVWISISSADITFSKLLNFRGSRDMIRERTVQSTMVEFIKFLK